MSYQQNIPHANDQFSQSQMDIQGNFQALNPIFLGINNYLYLPIQGSGPATSASQVALYAKTGIEGTPELFFRNASSGAEIEATGTLAASNGWSFLPSGMLIKWGTATVTRNSLNTVSFPVAGTIPVFQNLWNVQVTQTFAAGPTLSNLNCFLSAGNYLIGSFQVYPNAAVAPTSGTITIAYVAIGN